MLLSQQQQQQQQGAGADGFIRKRRNDDDDDGVLNRTVCVTSGISFIGLAIVNRLLSRGYTVRLALDTQEELEKVREMEMFEEHQIENYYHHHLRDGLVEEGGSTRSGGGVCAVVADMMDMESLCVAFHGCSCVFHTSAFIDPTGVSGYSKQMAEIEARIAERVIEACVRTQSVRNCVFTSSLVACIWRQNRSPHNYHVDENCWSDETLCRDRKLWYALGKTMAEKAAWRAARGRDLKLVTLCPGFVTGPGFRRRNSTASIAYLKGAQEMLTEGLLATVEIGKLAEAHVGVYEAMGSCPAVGSAPACGRYICFDHAISRVEEVAELERQLGMIISVTLPNRSTTSSNIVEVAAGGGGGSYHDINIPQPPTNWFKLSNRKLTGLMWQPNRRCSYDICAILYS